jgi:very-short-patch-repair endonuclease
VEDERCDMTKIKYLTEASLVKFLLDNIDQEGIHNKKFGKYRFRPDYVSHRHKLVVEFDGYLHYTKAKTVLDDYQKNDIIADSGYKIVRIPYFVQLSENVMSFLFGDHLEILPFDFVEYSHGFVDESAVLPADFCTLGVKRFENDLQNFCFISDDILRSLENISKRDDEKYPLNFTMKKAEPKFRL